MYEEIIKLHSENLRYKEEYKDMQKEFSKFPNSMDLSTCKMPSEKKDGDVVITNAYEKLDIDNNINIEKNKFTKNKNDITKPKKHPINLLEEIQAIKKLRIKEKLLHIEMNKKAEKERQYIIAKRAELYGSGNKVKNTKLKENDNKNSIDTSITPEQVKQDGRNKSKKGEVGKIKKEDSGKKKTGEQKGQLKKDVKQKTNTSEKDKIKKDSATVNKKDKKDENKKETTEKKKKKKLDNKDNPKETNKKEKQANIKVSKKKKNNPAN